MLTLPMPLGAFKLPKPAPDRPATVFPWALSPSPTGWRREKKLNLIGTINPEFKDLAQTWGWNMITVHEKMYRDHQVGTAARSCSLASVVESSEQHG